MTMGEAGLFILLSALVVSMYSLISEVEEYIDFVRANPGKVNGSHRSNNRRHCTKIEDI